MFHRTVGDVLSYGKGSKQAFWKLTFINELLPQDQDGHVCTEASAFDQNCDDIDQPDPETP